MHYSQRFVISLTPFTAGQLNSVAEALLLFIDSLAEPVVPYPFYAKCLDCCSNFTLCKQVSYSIFFKWPILFSGHVNNLISYQLVMNTNFYGQTLTCLFCSPMGGKNLKKKE